MAATDDLARNRELILQEERIFARAIAVSAIEKPRTSYWLVLIPILFLYYAYRIQKYKKSLLGFVNDFMITRDRAMDLAWDAATAGGSSDVTAATWITELSADLQDPYRQWLESLTEYYLGLLRQPGDSFDQLVRNRYRKRSEYLLALNSLGGAEKTFYAALKPRMQQVDGAIDIITTMEKTARTLRREQVEKVFP